MSCNWIKEDYFSMLMFRDKRAHLALEMLVDDLHADKDRTLSTFLCHSGSEDFLWGLVRLLGSDNPRVAGNSAYIIGTLAESELGCVRVLSLAKDGSPESKKILPDLTCMLTFDDSESVMNAAGTMGTLAESLEGREWILSEPCVENTIEYITALLHSDNLWTASNAALVLARLSISENGCQKILNHEHSHHILSKLVMSLGMDEAGRGMNAAFAIGRLCDMETGRKRLLALTDSERMNVVSKTDVNNDLREEALVTLEILKRLPKPSAPVVEVLCHDTVRLRWEPITTKSGFQVRYQLFDGIKCLYTGKESECEIKDLIPSTQYSFKVRAYTEGDESPFSDLVTITTDESAPGPPQNVRILGSTITQLKIGWDPPEVNNGVLKGYYVYLGEKQVEFTPENSTIITGLLPSTTYEVQVCAATAVGKGEKSGTVGTTAEIGAHAPSKPNIHVLGRNEIHLSWDPPEVPLGRFNRFDILMNGKVIYSGTDLNFTVRRLTPDTEYTFVVIALTTEGKFESKPAKKRTSKDEYDSSRPPLYQPPRKNSIEDGAKAPVITVKKRRNSSAKHLGSSKNRTRTTAESPDTRPVSAISSKSSHDTASEKEHEAQEEPPPKPEINIQPPVTPKAEMKKESSRPFSKSKSAKEKLHRRPEQIQNASKMFPLSVSYVSIQGRDENETEESTGDVRTPELEINPLRRNLSRTNTGIESSSGATAFGLKLERSKTVLVGAKERKQKISSAKLDQTNMFKMEKSSLVNSEGGKIGGIVTDKTSPLHYNYASEKEPNKVIESSKMADSGKSTDISDLLVVSHSDKPKHYSERSKAIIPSDRGRYVPRENKLSRELALPKPSPPSQQYQEGNVTVPDSHWMTHILPGSRRDISASIDSSDVQWLTTVKRASSDVISSTQPNHLTPTHPSDVSSYFIETLSQPFAQRVQTYSNSHRKTKLPAIHESQDYGKRPSVKKSLEKLPKSSASHKQPLQTLQVGQTVNFDSTTLGDKSVTAKMSNKFIPMQLRTQPSNLGIGQLQRMNTTILQDMPVENSVQFRRLEALTRSQTQVEMRQTGQHTIPSNDIMHGAGRIEHSIMGLPSSKSTHKDSKGSAHKSHPGSSKLTRAVVHQREPDSLYLQQAWGMASPKENSLQSAR
ncbi:hypothetical protein ACJMK2_038848 [Sinanodonta woodiana]|uniref:Fibronectin type-III domain-containing protein n=1 Tax=Sinanodonta woodiana TaxID=1069815 RepID=A0ABD3WDI6_SINWO